MGECRHQAERTLSPKRQEKCDEHHILRESLLLLCMLWVPARKKGHARKHGLHDILDFWTAITLSICAETQQG